MKIFVHFSLLGFCILFISCSGSNTSSITIKNAKVRQNIPPQTITAAYMAIHNQGSETALISASTPAAKVTELHAMTTDGNMMRMKKINRLPIPTNGSATLQPGGNHLMLIGLTHDLTPGNTLSLTLTFANGQMQTIDVPIVPIQNEK